MGPLKGLSIVVAIFAGLTLFQVPFAVAGVQASPTDSRARFVHPAALEATVEKAVAQNRNLARPAAVSPAWMKAPVLPLLGAKDQARLRTRAAAGRRLGARARVFAKIGDSNTEFAPNFYGLGCRKPVGLPLGLQKVRRKYRQVQLGNPRAVKGCPIGNSFSRRSSAAQAGVYSSWPLSRIENLPDTGYWAKPPGCSLETTPLDCEIDATRPRYALVMLGTNDIGMDIFFGTTPGSEIQTRLGDVARALLKRGVIPVLSTIPSIASEDPDNKAVYDAAVARTNAGIWKLSRTMRLPMINLWRSLSAPGVFNNGLSSDGLHLSVFRAGGEMIGVTPSPGTLTDSVDFSRPALRNGANRRNLIWLRTLARLDRIVG